MTIELLTAEQVAEICHVDKATIYRWLRSESKNFPKPIRLSPKKVLFRSKDVEDWIGGLQGP